MTYEITSDLSIKEIAEELFVYNRKNSTIYSFNGSGVFIWKLVAQHLPFDEISKRLCGEFDVTVSEAEADVADFVKNLLENGLITLLQK